LEPADVSLPAADEFAGLSDAQLQALVAMVDAAERRIREEMAPFQRRLHRLTRDGAAVQTEVRRRERDPGRRLLVIFDVFDGWFRSPDFEGCSFINVLLEYPDADHPLHRAAAGYLERIRGFLRELADDAGIADPAGFARQWHILMKGSIVAAGEGDRDAARRAQAIGRVLLADARTSHGPRHIAEGPGPIAA